MALSRRRFLGVLGGAGAGAVVGGGAWAGLARERAVDAATSPPSRTLVVVQLAGGNDGLNTVVPDDGRYRDARPTLGIAESSVLRPAGLGAYGLHPALRPMVPLVEAGHVAVVQSVGLHHRSRSHFECSQHWWDGSDGRSMSDTGWVGRWLDATKPSGTASPLRAIAVGGAAGAPALRASDSPSTVVIEPAAFRVGDPVFEAAYRKTGDASVIAALDAVDVLAGPLSSAPAGAATITDGLKVAAELITAGLGIEIILVGSGGFDTHAGQAATQERLLGDLATGVASFQASVAAAGLADRVLLLTTSEFGRRVAENGSAGTDHGAGSCLFAVGTMVEGGITGELDLAHLDQGDVMPMIDPRSHLATGLSFLGGDVDEVFESWEDLGVLVRGG